MILFLQCLSIENNCYDSLYIFFSTTLYGVTVLTICYCLEYFQQIVGQHNEFEKD